MRIDREYQNKILSELAECISEEKAYSFKDCLRPDGNGREEYLTAKANLFYLADHGLIEYRERKSLSADATLYAKIKSRGIDLLRQDGGLSAILGVVTVRLHQDTIMELVGKKIAQSDLTPADKRRWLDALQTLPGDAIRHLTLKLLDKGLENLPEALRLIGTSIGWC